MAPPRRGNEPRRQRSKQTKLATITAAVAAASSSSSRQVPEDIEDAAQPSAAGAGQPTLSGLPGVDQQGQDRLSAAELERLEDIEAASHWFPLGPDGLPVFPRRAAPADAINAESQEIFSIHSDDEEEDDEDGPDDETREDDPHQQPGAQDSNDGQPRPSRKRKASITLTAPEEKKRATIAPRRQAGMSILANDQGPAPASNIGSDLGARFRQVLNLPRGRARSPATGTASNLGGAVAQESVTAIENNTLRAKCLHIEAKRKKLADERRALNTAFDRLRKENDQLKKENEALRRQHAQDLKDADAADKQIKKLEEKVADLVDKVDTYEEITMPEADEERERVLAAEGRENREESENPEEEHEEELEDEL